MFFLFNTNGNFQQKYDIFRFCQNLESIQNCFSSKQSFMFKNNVPLHRHLPLLNKCWHCSIFNALSIGYG